VIIIGQKIYPFDNLRYETYLATLGGNKNIQIVATVEGNYDPDKSMAGMQDVLQANKDINVVLSNADQHLVGAEIALEDAGLDVPSLFLIGGGANQIAIDAIKAGKWDATLAQLPVSEGEYALNGVVDALEGEAAVLDQHVVADGDLFVHEHQADLAPFAGGVDHRHQVVDFEDARRNGQAHFS